MIVFSLIVPRAEAQMSPSMTNMGQAKFNDWATRWEANINGDSGNRYCDTAMGEDIAWLMQPFLRGFYYGYMITNDTKWVDKLVDWTDSWVVRGVQEPDGYLGWPAIGAAGTDVDSLNTYYADSMLGDAMALRPIVQLSAEILRTPALAATYGAKARSYIALSEQMFAKWDSRSAWKDTANGGCISVVYAYGIDSNSWTWTAGYSQRNVATNGFSHPNNKANEVARWLLAMYDATKNRVYRDRAEKWFKLLKSRIHLSANGTTYEIWNYWEPAGPWDYKPDTSTKHWVGVHPNAGYYEIDTGGIIDGYEHGLAFTKDDINCLITTGIYTQRLWTALAPYNNAFQANFEANNNPSGWGGLGDTPWYLALQIDVMAGMDKYGIPAAWKIQNFGCVMGPGTKAMDDADQDGANNLAEYKAGTSPTNSLSVLKITQGKVNSSTNCVIGGKV